MLLHGPGGCGKSVVIRALATMLRRDGHGVALAAPTGCAAFLINGCTLHSCLHLPVENNSYGCASDAPLPSGPMLEHLISFWKPVRVLIIDEISMVSSTMAARIDERLQLYKRKKGVPFGGLHLLCCGDMYQLPPPRGQPLFGATHLWKLFLLCELEGNHRAATDPEYAALLARLRVGKHTSEDEGLLRTRMQHAPAECSAPRLLATRRAVAVVNNEMLEKHAKRKQVAIHQAPAADVAHATGLPIDPNDLLDDPEDTAGLEMNAQFAVGARVMLRRNIDIADGLVNGARGEVAKIRLSESGEVLAVDVLFDKGGRRWREEAGGTPDVSITPVQGGFISKAGDRVLRRQFPLVLAYAMTIHKSQGATEQHGVVATLDKSVNQPCQAYVALSRVQRLNDLYLVAFEPTSIIPAVGVEFALLQLRVQQAYHAQGLHAPSPLWKKCFAPKDSASDLENAFRAASKPTFMDRTTSELAAKAAEAAGDRPEFACDHCGEGFFSAGACKKHMRACPLNTLKGKRRSRMNMPASSKNISNIPEKLVTAKPGAKKQPSFAALRASKAPLAVAAEEQRRRKRPRWAVGALTIRPALPVAPERPNPPIENAALFFQRQREAMCGLHALNNAVGEDFISHQDMVFACESFIQEAAVDGIMWNVDDHVAPGGWYSSEVMAHSLRTTSMQKRDRITFQMDLRPLGDSPGMIHAARGAVVNTPHHWVALRSVRGVIWLLDSLRPAPEALANAEYESFISKHRRVGRAL